MSHVHDSTSQLPVGNQEADSEGNAHHNDGSQDGGEPMSVDTCARQRRRIAQLEQKLESLESGRAVKDRFHHICIYEVGFAHQLSGKSITIWPKEEPLDVLFLCSIMSRSLSVKMTADTKPMKTQPIASSKFFTLGSFVPLTGLFI